MKNASIDQREIFAFFAKCHDIGSAGYDTFYLKFSKKKDLNYGKNWIRIENENILNL